MECTFHAPHSLSLSGWVAFSPIFVYISAKPTPSKIRKESARLPNGDPEYPRYNEVDSNGDEDNSSQAASSSRRRKTYERHTPEQIRILEEFYQRCQRPDQRDRERLGTKLGMSPLRVKFWFQNRRTQTKNKSNQLMNEQLKGDNERIRQENFFLNQKILTAICNTCCIGAHQDDINDVAALRSENAELREKINEQKRIVEEYYKVSVPSTSSRQVNPAPEIPPHGATLGLDPKAVTDLAESAAGELFAMATIKEPLWLPIGPDNTEILNEQEYTQNFNGGMLGCRPLGYALEATRSSIMLSTSVSGLIDVFMNAGNWAAIFFDIVSRAMTMQVLSKGKAGSSDGCMKVISAEFQLPTPLVPQRECFFLRYCKKQPQGRTWIIADVSLDSLIQPESFPNYRRRPSGCIIQEMPDKLVELTWVEHVEVDDRSTRNIYKTMVNWGMAFGAKRCVAILSRQLDRIRFVQSQYDSQTIIPQIQTTTILRLAERMTISFNSSACGNKRKNWIPINGTGQDNVLILGRVNTEEPGKPIGVVFCATTSFRLPCLPKAIFEFLLDDSKRKTWNMLYEGGIFEKLADIPIGSESGNRVSVYYVNGVQSSHNLNKESMFIQESCSDVTGSYIIYAPLSTVSMNVLATDNDPDKVPLLASGFSVFPDGPRELCGGSLVTVAFQFHVDPNPMLVDANPHIVAGITNLVKETESRIRNAILED